MPKNKRSTPKAVTPGMVFVFCLKVIEKDDPYVPPSGGKPVTRWKCRYRGYGMGCSGSSQGRYA